MYLESPSPQWQQAQNRFDAHFLQRSEWGEFQRALGKKIFYSSGDGWSWLAILEKGRLGDRLYCPYGPTVTSPKALDDALTALIACTKEHKLSYIRIEPQGPLAEVDLHARKLRPAHRDIQPRYTFVKDLAKSEDELLTEMSATNRNLYRTAANKGLTFHTSTDPNDISIFLHMIHEVANRNDITIHPDHYYQTMAQTLMPLGACKLYIAEHEGQPVASSLIFDSPTTRCYAHAGSHFHARKLHPSSPLLAQIIFDAKASGQTRFDFFGIAPPDQPNHRWAGFTQFKQSFGGTMIDRHGTWELGLKKIYVFYRGIQKFL